MKKSVFQGTLTALILLAAFNFAAAHCEIPCGIYDDEMRIHMIAEHMNTIEKSMKKIDKLQDDSKIDYNQLVRWIMNKENHANALQEIVTQYFMTQRIKPDVKDYEKKLSLLHKMLIFSMKCKQTADLVHVKTLRSLLKEFENLYFGKAQK
ncbi:MAG: superoxide dismutase [Deltaproteobacteria bacterium]|nr:superoxide dismutase [Deltaproteobacteria bacterium]